MKWPLALLACRRSSRWSNFLGLRLDPSGACGASGERLRSAEVWLMPQIALAIVVGTWRATERIVPAGRPMVPMPGLHILQAHRHRVARPATQACHRQCQQSHAGGAPSHSAQTGLSRRCYHCRGSRGIDEGLPSFLSGKIVRISALIELFPGGRKILPEAAGAGPTRLASIRCRARGHGHQPRPKPCRMGTGATRPIQARKGLATFRFDPARLARW